MRIDNSALGIMILSIVFLLYDNIAQTGLVRSIVLQFYDGAIYALKQVETYFILQIILLVMLIISGATACMKLQGRIKA